MYFFKKICVVFFLLRYLEVLKNKSIKLKKMFKGKINLGREVR